MLVLVSSHSHWHQSICGLGYGGLARWTRSIEAARFDINISSDGVLAWGAAITPPEPAATGPAAGGTDGAPFASCAGWHDDTQDRPEGGGPMLRRALPRSARGARFSKRLGLIGGPLIILSGTLVLFDVVEPGSGAQVIATVPEFLWELSLGIYLMVKGFKPSPITAGLASPAAAAPV
jgi:hypothetical protein